MFIKYKKYVLSNYSKMSEVDQVSSDELIKFGNFKSPNTAYYIIDRKSSSFQAVGSNVYTPKNGVTVIRFQKKSWDFLDPSSIHVQFDIKTTQIQGQKYYILLSLVMLGFQDFVYYLVAQPAMLLVNFIECVKC